MKVIVGFLMRLLRWRLEDAYTVISGMIILFLAAAAQIELNC